MAANDSDESEGHSASPPRRRRQSSLDDQLRALYESYAAGDIPEHILELVAKVEDAYQNVSFPDDSAGKRRCGRKPDEP